MKTMTLAGAVAMALVLGNGTAMAGETLSGTVAFNTGIQLPNGDGVNYSFDFGGDLEGCSADAYEELDGRDGGARGYFDIEAFLSCPDGSFTYVTSGAWGSTGFTASGTIVEGTGSGLYEGKTGRVMTVAGTGSPKDDGTFDIAYTIYFDFAD